MLIVGSAAQVELHRRAAPVGPHLRAAYRIPHGGALPCGVEDKLVGVSVREAGPHPLVQSVADVRVAVHQRHIAIRVEESQV